ncbi:hypothetical protein Dimus_039694 [Dionaea muscipula]
MVECAGFSTPGPSSPKWTLYVDGSSAKTGGGAGLILTSPEGSVVEYALRFDFPVTNNEAEYEALIAGIKLAKELGARSIQLYSDSQLIVNQVKGDYNAEKPNMQQYCKLAQDLLRVFDSFEVTQVPRGQNTQADALSKLGSSPGLTFGKTVFVERLAKKSTELLPETLPIADSAPNWMTPIKAFLENGTLPDNRDEAKKLHIRAANFRLINGVLYKQLYQHPCARCLTAPRGPSMSRKRYMKVLVADTSRSDIGEESTASGILLAELTSRSGRICQAL